MATAGDLWGVSVCAERGPLLASMQVSLASDPARRLAQGVCWGEIMHSDGDNPEAKILNARGFLPAEMCRAQTIGRDDRCDGHHSLPS
jgi:hypothetical protein